MTATLRQATFDAFDLTAREEIWGNGKVGTPAEARWIGGYSRLAKGIQDQPLEKKPDDLPGLRPKKPERRMENQRAGRWLGFGVEFMGVIVFFMWLGHLADKKFQTSQPWWMLTGFFVAFTGMIYLLLKETGSIKFRNDRNDRG